MLTTNGTDNSKAFSMQLLTRRLPLPSLLKGINNSVMHLQYELDSSSPCKLVVHLTMAILIISAVPVWACLELFFHQRSNLIVECVPAKYSLPIKVVTYPVSGALHNILHVGAATFDIFKIIRLKLFCLIKTDI